MTNGIIFNIKKFAIHDGPGIRTTVFLKGCPLRCQWCHNPESWLKPPEISFNQEECIKCYQCLSLCTNKAISLKGDYPYTDKSKCILCGTCVSQCPNHAREIIGRRVAAKEIIQEVKKDIIFYQESNGGVTFSGGEPLEQIDFLSGLLTLCQKENIHRVVDTCGYAPWSHIERILPMVNIWLYDFKLLDEEKHKQYTGVSNQIILENLRRLSGESKNIEIRIPLIPGINDDKKELAEMAGFVHSLAIAQVSILPFHRLGLDKYRRLGLASKMKQIQAPSGEHIQSIMRLFSKTNLKVNIGG